MKRRLKADSLSQFFHISPTRLFQWLVTGVKFKYKKIAPGLVRPIIPIDLSYKHFSPISYEALADSGADICVFPSQIGELMGINIKSGSVGQLQGVIGKTGKIYYHDICIDIGGYQYIVNAAFSYSAKLQYGFLGHRGIFNKFIIQFQTRKEVVEFRQETNIN